MTRKPRELSGEERRLWTRVAAGVKPRPGKSAHLRAEASHEARSLRAAPAAPAPAVAPAKRHAPHPADRSAEKRVRRGKLDIGGALDLHGHTQLSARAALERFVRAAQRRGDRVVLVVTGAGRGGDGVLKRRLPEWLAEASLRHVVSGYSKAHRTHGGEGAFYLFLRLPS